MLEFLESLVRNYGYLALFVGTFLEGETILLFAGFLAHNGQMALSMCILTAFCGSLAGDQTAFYVGRWKGRQFIAKRPAWQSRVERVHRMLERFHEVLILSFRFFYGLRNLTPFILGTTDVSGLKFFLLNAVGAAVWATVFGIAGYLFGEAVNTVLKDVKHVQVIILLAAVMLFAAVWLFRRYRRRKAESICLVGKKEDTESAPESAPEGATEGATEAYPETAPIVSKCPPPFETPEK
jgi:membrane protein DedA with SNARE-associated domain